MSGPEVHRCSIYMESSQSEEHRTQSACLSLENDLGPGDSCEEGYPLRPDIVWFGEAVPLLGTAAEWVIDAEILIVVGTSLQVYPAAGLLGYKQPGVPLYLIDPNPSLRAGDIDIFHILPERAATGLPILANQLIDTWHGSIRPIHNRLPFHLRKASPFMGPGVFIQRHFFGFYRFNHLF